MPLTVVATSKERVEAESLIQAANGNESKDALRSRIRQSGFVCRERGELMFAFSPMVAASQADYNLQAIVCLLTEPKPLECPHLRTLLEQDINEQIRDTIELDERMNDALRDRPELEGVLKDIRARYYFREAAGGMRPASAAGCAGVGLDGVRPNARRAPL